MSTLNNPLLYSLAALKKIKKRFFRELVAAKAGKKTSLAFIRNRLSPQSVIKDDEQIQVMVIGGTKFETRLMQKSRERFKTVPYKIDTPRTAFDFFSFLEKHLDPRTTTLAINFAYPLKPVLRNKILDGKLICGTKENQFKGLVGKLVGEEIEKYFWEKHKRKINVTVVNDIVCLALAGTGNSNLTKKQFNNYSHIVAGVIGTGLNFGLFLDQHTVVNLESANFDKFKPTETGKLIDINSTNVGQHLFEKEVAGAYLYQHLNFFCEKIGLDIKPLETTEQLSHMASKNFRVETFFAKIIMERSASLTACQIAGLYKYKRSRRILNRAGSPEPDAISGDLRRAQSDVSKRSKYPRLIFIMEGGLFWQGWKYKQMVQKYLKKLGIPDNAIKFVQIKNSCILGATRLIANS